MRNIVIRVFMVLLMMAIFLAIAFLSSCAYPHATQYERKEAIYKIVVTGQTTETIINYSIKGVEYTDTVLTEKEYILGTVIDLYEEGELVYSPNPPEWDFFKIINYNKDNTSIKLIKNDSTKLTINSSIIINPDLSAYSFAYITYPLYLYWVVNIIE